MSTRVTVWSTRWLAIIHAANMPVELTLNRVCAPCVRVQAYHGIQNMSSEAEGEKLLHVEVRFRCRSAVSSFVIRPCPEPVVTDALCVLIAMLQMEIGDTIFFHPLLIHGSGSSSLVHLRAILVDP